MKIGIMTVPFNDWKLEQVLDYVSKLGYEAVEIAAWKGSNHIDIEKIIQGGATNFKKTIEAGGSTVWVSDGTTPNGNLSGTAGDICLNGTSGQTFYCTGTTNWTGM